MRNIKTIGCFFVLLFVLYHPSAAYSGEKGKLTGQPKHKDTAYTQDYSVKYDLGTGLNEQITLQKVICDRNAVVKIISSAGLLSPSNGRFLYPGKLVSDVSYLPMVSKNIKDMILYQDQFVYADDKAVLSNAWAGKLYSQHSMPAVNVFCGGPDFDFLLSDGSTLQYIRDSKLLATVHTDEKALDIVYDKKRNCFWILGANSVSRFDIKTALFQKKFTGSGLTCFALASEETELVIGTHQGYFKIDPQSGLQQGPVISRLPCADLTVVKEIDGMLWFGTANGAFNRQPDGKFKYYASRRWIPSNYIKYIARGSNGSVLILTDRGLAEIHFGAMTLYEKAMYYERQVRARHIRLGFNATLSRMKNGDVGTGSMEDSDNDGLWTSMYLGAEVFRYAATKSAEVLENCRESLDAMERLYTITSIKGFPARSYERRGFELSDIGVGKHPDNPSLDSISSGNAGVQSPFEVWRHAKETEWDWKSTTSSDEAIGHMFVFGAIAELIDVPEIKNKAIRLMDALMQHIVDHRMYLVDWNGQPTAWGKWNPEYVNARPKIVGDRKINSSNIISMLQTAYHFTGKAIFKDKALELLNQYGYLENLMRSMKDVGRAPDSADALSKDLSENWNHSDDEMYFLGYWGLYRYALNDTLKAKFKEAILDHWQIERPEKEGAWDILTAITGVKNFDLPEAIWYLQKYPLDMIDWKVTNSQRKDIDFIPPNFRRQTIKEVLPPDELPVNRHNANRFDLDGGDENGTSEFSAGDIWLLPYWMGRYLKVISEPLPSAASDKEVKIARNRLPGSPRSGYDDSVFTQRYSIKYYNTDSSQKLLKVRCDHNGNIKVLAQTGLLSPMSAALLQPGSLQNDFSYQPMAVRKVAGLCLYKDEFVYTNGYALLSNAWAGTLYIPHGLKTAWIVAAGNNFSFLVSDGNQIKLLQNKKQSWSGSISPSVLDIQYDKRNNKFWILSPDALYSFSEAGFNITRVFSGQDFNCFKVTAGKILIGTRHGYLEIADGSGLAAKKFDKLPAEDIRVIEEVNGQLWFGSSKGAFTRNRESGFDYFESERWLPGDEVVDIAQGRDKSVLVLTTRGLAEICQTKMTLRQKADYYESIVRKRHIRYGFYCDYTAVTNACPDNGQMRPHDSDNLWTSMYLSAELFRYLTTHEPEAKKNCIESLDAMERLFTLSGITGLFGRCIERSGTVDFAPEIRDENKDYWYPGYDSVPSSWVHSANKEWDWRGSASSDQAVGQYFALTMAARFMDEDSIKQKAIRLIDELTSYILDHNLQLIDVDGRPTLWGRWNPEYVNRFPDMVGDKKLYASNIISFLQTAWHFTGKEKYRVAALTLLNKEKYLTDLTRPIKEIGPAPASADKWSQLMSGGWNSSDDEMYFLAYWGLYPYAFNADLQKKYKEAIYDHWNFIRPEKESLWNLCYAAITGSSQCDINETVWELKRMPMDLRTWSIQNSGRKDLVFLKQNSLERTTATVLPPDERPENKHNRNFFKLDDNGTGNNELGGGDVYLLPYWMGRYFQFISPENAGTKTDESFASGLQ